MLERHEWVLPGMGDNHASRVHWVISWQVTPCEGVLVGGWSLWVGCFLIRPWWIGGFLSRIRLHGGAQSLEGCRMRGMQLWLGWNGRGNAKGVKRTA